MTQKEKQQRSNLAKTAIFLLEDTANKFEMDYFAKTAAGNTLYPRDFKHNTCGTTCCFAGYGPLALKNGKFYDKGWVNYTSGSFGISDGRTDQVWEFLFDQDWPNDRKQAAARALWYLNGNYAGGGYDKNSDILFYKSYSKAKLIKELSKHIYIRNR